MSKKKGEWDEEEEEKRRRAGGVVTREGEPRVRK